MLVSLAAAAAVFAGCGGGADPAMPGNEAAATAHAAAAATVTDAGTPPATAATVLGPQAADTGPISLSDMDTEAQAEAAADAQRQLHAADADAAKSTAGTPVDKAGAQADKAQARPDTNSASDAAATTDADARTAAAAAEAIAAAAPAAATRSGGRSVPLPTVLATATAVSGTSGSGAELQEAVVAPRAINSTDIRLQVEADRLFSSYKWAWGMECAGQKAGAVNIPEYGMLGFDLGGGLGSTRFGKVPDPENSTRKVLMFRPNSGDPLVSGAPRCEMTFSPSFGGKLPVNQDVWFAFGLRLKDWVNTTDEQILMQWHWSNGSIPLGPFLALSLKGGKLQIDSKANAAYPPKASTTTSRVHWTNGTVASNTWTYFVVKARISPHTSHNPYLKVWRDGTQIVNYAGPFGYNYPEVTPYVKIGHYQWVAAYNNWISAASTKTILVRTPALINDPTGLYTEFDVRTHVKNR
jgi:hypothetical protein